MNKQLSVNRSTIADLDEKRMFYHKLFGYTYLKFSSACNVSENTTVRLALPGISWDEEYDDYISEKIFQAGLVPIYHTQVELNTITSTL